MTAAAVRAHNRANAVRARQEATNRCLLAVQAKVRGYQDLRVAAATSVATDTGHGVISVRVGQVLIYLEDRPAMYSWVAAIQRAIELQDGAYGPEMLPPRTGPDAA